MFKASLNIKKLNILLYLNVKKVDINSAAFSFSGAKLMQRRHLTCIIIFGRRLHNQMENNMTGLYTQEAHFLLLI